MKENTSQYKKELAEIDQALDLQTEAISRISKSQLMTREKIFQMELAQKKFNEEMKLAALEDQQKMTEIRYIGVEFDYQKVDTGQRLVNEALAEGFQPLKDYDRGSGIVMVLVKWRKEFSVTDNCNFSHKGLWRQF